MPGLLLDYIKSPPGSQEGFLFYFNILLINIVLMCPEMKKKES
jgi:hypothetical protein